MHPIVYLAVLICAALLALKSRSRSRSRHGQVPVSVSYHFTRLCNKTCGFCFHTAKTSYVETPARAKQGLRLLKEAGMRKINFAGGEPFLDPKFLGEMIDFCKQTLHLESVSLVTNGSLVRESFLRQHGENLDILAVSCDSFDEATNIKIGRGSGDQVSKLYDIASWCRKYNIKFKINTVVNRLNFSEDMNSHINALAPFRWKCFQVLIVDGENDSEATLRDAREFVISDEEYELFCQRHRGQASFVPEPNNLMAQSYLIIDEYMRFLDKSGEKASESILQVGVEEALRSVVWDEQAFLERGGLYDWTKSVQKSPCSVVGKELEW